LPWSMWAMMQKFRMLAWSVVGTPHRTDAGRRPVRLDSAHSPPRRV
jgi:hypothetical protein